MAHTRLPSVGFRSWSRFLAVSLQVTWVINPAEGCHHFLPGPPLPSQPLRGCYQFRCSVNRSTIGVNSLPKTVTRQRRGCNLKFWTHALLRLSPARYPLGYRATVCLVGRRSPRLIQYWAPRGSLLGRQGKLEDTISDISSNRTTIEHVANDIFSFSWTCFVCLLAKQHTPF